MNDNDQTVLVPRNILQSFRTSWLYDAEDDLWALALENKDGSFIAIATYSLRGWQEAFATLNREVEKIRKKDNGPQNRPV